jgi:hypothetical protein
MDDPKSSGEQGASPQTKIVKKKYDKPQIVYSAPLEAMAAICPLPGKMDIVNCPSVINS